MDYTEKDIENLFRDHYADSDIGFVGQQVRVETGIIDLLFYNKRFGNPIVVEVKKGKAPKTTLTQLLGYMWYLESRLSDTDYGIQHGEWLPKWNNVGRVHGIILAENIDDGTWRALRYSPNILFIKYQVTSRGVRFFRPWEINNKFTPSIHPDPVINKVVRITELITMNERITRDRAESINDGGLDTYSLCKDDLLSKNNTIWKR